MLLKNLSDTLCNGSRGVVIGFEPLKEDDDDDEKSLIEYLTMKENPVRDENDDDDNDEADYEQDDNNEDEDERYQGRDKKRMRILYPVVKFANGEIRTIGPEKFSVGGKPGRATRVQIPLKVQ